LGKLEGAGKEGEAPNPHSRPQKKKKKKKGQTRERGATKVGGEESGPIEGLETAGGRSEVCTKV